MNSIIVQQTFEVHQGRWNEFEALILPLIIEESLDARVRGTRVLVRVVPAAVQRNLVQRLLGGRRRSTLAPTNRITIESEIEHDMDNGAPIWEGEHQQRWAAAFAAALNPPATLVGVTLMRNAQLSGATRAQTEQRPPRATVEAKPEAEVGQQAPLASVSVRELSLEEIATIS